MRSLLPLSFLLTLTLCLASGASPRNAPPAEGTQVIDVTAKKYEFSPSPIRVKQGTRVQLKITATDHTHGFRITPFASGETKGNQGLVFSSGPGCVKIEKAHTEIVEFVAQTPGTYTFQCCVHC